MGNGPDILICVGATKAGTTWLHHQLSAHPDCYFRSIKEYHYFSTNGDAQWAKLIADTRAEIEQLSGLPDSESTPRLRQRLDDLTSYLPLIAAREIDPVAFGDYLRRSAPQGAKLVGDFTPAYSVIAPKRLEPMLKMGALRVVYLIRDPLSRLWSHIRMIADRIAPENFERTCEGMLARAVVQQDDGDIRGILRRGNYAGNLPKLQKLFGDQLLVMFTEDLFTKTGFDRMLAFLGLAPAAVDLGRRVHEGRAHALPEHLRARALKFLAPQYDYIAQTLSPLPLLWRDRMMEMTHDSLAQKVPS